MRTSNLRLIGTAEDRARAEELLPNVAETFVVAPVAAIHTRADSLAEWDVTVQSARDVLPYLKGDNLCIGLI